MKTSTMRQFLFIPCLFSISFLIAQNKKPEYYQNAYEPPAQKVQQVDCYARKVDSGTSAYRRGDYRAALRLYEEAKECPETRGSSRRVRDLEVRIENCQERLGLTVKAESSKIKARSAVGITTTGRRFNRSAAFARNTDPNCFQMTVREADRAFRDSCWDDAAKLYRAAKTCVDASQTHRERMNVRIEACRAAAEDELLQKEQQAIRAARHAVAASLSDDVLDLLRQGNRSLAWRLGDFANFYLAPDDNPDCLNAMYSTYYYEQPDTETESINPPFCYQLSEVLAPDVQVRFTTYESELKLTFFVPAEQKISVWEFPSLNSFEYPLGFVKDQVGFDFDPNGELLVCGANYFFLSNGMTLNVPTPGQYCFNDDGSLFLYEDGASVQIVDIDQSAWVQQQRNAKYDKIGRSNSRPGNLEIARGLLAMAFHQDELWLGYGDRVEIFDFEKRNGTMVPRKTWTFNDSTLASSNSHYMKLFPASKEVVMANLNEIYYFSLKTNDTGNEFMAAPMAKIKGELQDCSAGPDALLLLHSELAEGNWEEIMTVQALSANPQILNRFYTRSGGITRRAAIAPDGRWAATQDVNGKTSLWALQDTIVTPPVPFKSMYGDQFSRDGNHLYSKSGNNFYVYDVDDIERGAEQVFHTISDPIVPEGSSNNWAVYFSNNNELAIKNLHSKQAFQFDILQMGGRVSYTFDGEEKRYFAYSPGSGIVKVAPLDSSLSTISRDFGGSITQLESVPGTNKIVVVTKFSGDRYTVKVWDFSKPDAKPQVLRLQDYNVRYLRVSEQGDRIALSNTADIRLYLLNNLNDENVVIKPQKAYFISDIEFRPDGLALASADDEGNITIWDVTNGKSLLSFSNTWAGQKYPVNRLAFAYGGSRLRIIAPNQLMAANLDPYTLRDAVQSGDRWLSSFSSQQIQAYNLEDAFRFPGNFDRLAQSGDLPLLRSFFQYFREQSISSNNIDQVRTYCERAYFLFELLDVNGQGSQEATMLEMYEDYILKLLLRNNYQEASGVVQYLNKQFTQSETSVISAAHTALVEHNLQAASKLYTEYLLRASSGAEMFDHKLDKINVELSQFQEYGLLDSAQINCLCGVFQPFNAFGNLCPANMTFRASDFTAQVQIYRNIYRTIDSAAYLINTGNRVRLLEQTYALANNLEQEHFRLNRHPKDTVAIALAQAYLDNAEFEQNSRKVPALYAQAVSLLDSITPLFSLLDTARLSFLTRANLQWGKYLLEIDKPLEAIPKFEASLAAGDKLAELYSSVRVDNEDIIFMKFISPAYLELSRAYLLKGEPEDAMIAYSMAEGILESDLKSFLPGHASLLEQDESAAVIAYGGALYTASELGEVLYQIGQLADLLPSESARIRDFMPRLRTAFLQNHPEINPAEVDYTTASFQTSRYYAKSNWDSTLIWSNKAVESLNQLMKTPADSDVWRNPWISQQISHAYYLLCAKHKDTSVLSSIISLSKNVLEKIKLEDPFSGLKTFVFTNMAHAYYLRNQIGDRDKAYETYTAHQNTFSYQFDPWELLQKDFRDLHQVGIEWPDLKSLIERIKPASVELTQEEWREMGLE